MLVRPDSVEVEPEQLVPLQMNLHGYYLYGYYLHDYYLHLLVWYSDQGLKVTLDE